MVFVGSLEEDVSGIHAKIQRDTREKKGADSSWGAIWEKGRQWLPLKGRRIWGVEAAVQTRTVPQSTNAPEQLWGKKNEE